MQLNVFFVFLGYRSFIAVLLHYVPVGYAWSGGGNSILRVEVSYTKASAAASAAAAAAAAAAAYSLCNLPKRFSSQARRYRLTAARLGLSQQ